MHYLIHLIDGIGVFITYNLGMLAINKFRNRGQIDKYFGYTLPDPLDEWKFIRPSLVNDHIGGWHYKNIRIYRYGTYGTNYLTIDGMLIEKSNRVNRYRKAIEQAQKERAIQKALDII
jgi:hypothetical protein